MNQREAVYNATKSTLKDMGITFEDGSNISEIMTEDIRKKVHAIVVQSFKDGKVEFKDTPSNQEKLSDDSKLNSYVSGLISNWYRKDKRFNGNTKYTAKNPGSRSGQGDPQLKALKQLYKQFEGTDEDKAAEIKKHIDVRLSEIAAEKAKKVEINLNAIPDELKEALDL